MNQEANPYKSSSTRESSEAADSDSLLKPAVPVWYWTVAVVALLWNVMGCVAFATELFAQEAAIKSWTAEQKEWAQSIPGWIYFVYGVAVISGVGGSIGLLMRKAWSIGLFAICLVTVIVQMVYTMIIAGGLQVLGPSALIMPALVISLAAILLWFSWFSKGSGWLDVVSQTLPNEGAVSKGS